MNSVMKNVMAEFKFFYYMHVVLSFASNASLCSVFYDGSC